MGILGQADILLLLVLVVAAFLALQLRDLLAAIASLSVYSFVIVALFAILGAADVAFIEATLGAGITVALLIATVFATQRRSED